MAKNGHFFIFQLIILITAQVETESMTLMQKVKDILYLLSFVETPRKFIIAELLIRKLGSSSVLRIPFPALSALMKIRAYGSKALQ